MLVLEITRKLARDHLSDLPGGKVEKNETIEQAAVREIKEETGLIMGKEQIKKIAKFKYFIDSKYVIEYLFCAFLENIDQKNMHLNPKEHDSFKFCELSDLHKEDFHNQILEEINKSKSKICDIYKST